MNKKIDVFAMYYTAREFSDCADFCLKQHDNTEGILFYVNPAAVNAAFACEIYLKLLLYLNNIDYKKIHTLKELFNLLPENIKADVKYNTVMNFGQWRDSFGFELLDNISNVFNELRYIYERDWSKNGTMRIETGFLIAFRNALQEQFKGYYFMR